MADGPIKRTSVSKQAALEEAFFLGLRLVSGVNLRKLATDFGDALDRDGSDAISECEELELLERNGDWIRLTRRGRLLSNEVFERFIMSTNETDILSATLTWIASGKHRFHRATSRSVALRRRGTTIKPRLERATT